MKFHVELGVGEELGEEVVNTDWECLGDHVPTLHT